MIQRLSLQKRLAWPNSLGAPLEGAAGFSMPAWTAGKAAVAAGSANTTLIFGGTSMTMGAFSQPATTFTNCRVNSYPMQLLPFLADTLDQGWSGTNQTYTTETITGYDPRFTSATAWGGLSGSNTLGGHLISNTTTADKLIFAGAANQIDTIEAWGPLLTGLGVIGVDIGGATLSPTINEGASSTGIWNQTWNVALGTYNINWSRVSGSCYLAGFVAYNSAVKRILAFNCGMSGSRASDWADSSLGYSPINMLKARAPSMFVWEIGANDWANATNLTTFSNAVQTVDDAVRSYGGDMIIMSSPPSDVSVASLAAQQSYIDILASKARVNRRNFINNTTVFGSYVQGNANGYYANTVHLNGTGYSIMKNAPLELLSA